MNVLNATERAHLKMVKMANFLLCAFCKIFKIKKIAVSKKKMESTFFFSTNILTGNLITRICISQIVWVMLL